MEAETMNAEAIEHINKEIDQLDSDDQLILLDMLVHKLLQNRKSKNSKPIMEYYGLMKGLWDGEDAQDYVNGLREDRQ